MGKIAFVFAGQGAQYSGMGESLYGVSAAARQVFDTAETVRPGTKAQCFAGSPEELSITENTQPCLFCVDLAAAQALREAGIEPDMVAGFSLGEVAAVTFAGVLTPTEGFALVTKRGAFMQAAAEQADSAMAAVLKLEHAKVETLCEKHAGVYPVNYNCPGQLVAAGLKPALAAFTADVTAAGGRAVPLNVSGGFHSPFMEPAAKQLGGVLKEMQTKAPGVPVYANYTAEPYGADDAAVLLEKQVCHPVRWQQTVERMIADGADTFVEVGPGKTLSGLIKKIDRSVTVLHVEDAQTLQAAIAALRAE